MSKRRKGKLLKDLERKEAPYFEPIDDPEGSHNQDTEPDWEGKCSSCGASPIVPVTGMCGPCTFGEADTLGGNW